MKKKPIIETHGKVEGLKPTTLEQIWGHNELSRYGTVDENVYRQQVDEMSRTDLEAHARKLGVVIVESTTRLRDKLVKEFRTHQSLLYRPDSPKQPEITLDEKVKRILAEGR